MIEGALRAAILVIAAIELMWGLIAAIIVIGLAFSLAPPITGKLAFTYVTATAVVFFPGAAICLVLFEQGKRVAYFALGLLAVSPASYMALRYVA